MAEPLLSLEGGDCQPPRREAHGAPASRGALLPSAIRPVGRQRLADGLVEQIRRLIVEAGLESGARLPSERELAHRCGASRAVVAQALRTLSLMGLVEIRQGSGAYVARNARSMMATTLNVLVDLEHGSLEELCQLRLWLESIGAHAGIEAPARIPFDDLRGALERLARSDGNASALIAGDTIFHALIVSAANNAYLSTLYESVHTEIVTLQYERWIRTDQAPQWLVESGTDAHLRLHQPIVDALASADGTRLDAALGAHHEALWRHLAAQRLARR